MQLPDAPHRRRNQLTGEYVTVSPHRAKRPWQGKAESLVQTPRQAYDAGCYLCPNNRRANGSQNPDYKDAYIFPNDFAALLPDAPDCSESNGLLEIQSVKGVCKVMCFSPRHDLTLAEMSEPEILRIIEGWQAETALLGETYQWIQIFENKGKLMGCSNPHPHGQIWALNALPNEARKEDIAQQAYMARGQSPLLVDYLHQELREETRIVVENGHWAALVPFWAAHPFETLLLPKRPIQRLTELAPDEARALASILKTLLVKYDNLFETSFPYSMGWHQAPNGLGEMTHWQLHAHYYPPLLRSATVKKFIVGYELLSEIQRDFTPEQAAARLRAQPTTHYQRC
jgi:UDPglucose--hexose-1-phosphate uridylyltransferase